MTDLYKQEIIDPGDEASKLAKDVCVASYGNNAAARIIPRQPGNFRGAVDFVWAKHVLQMMIEGKMRETIQNDGAGGKPQFFTLLGTEDDFRLLGWEIVCMVIDDIVRSGGFPVIFSNDINAKRVTKENIHLVRALIEGFGNILHEANLINITGEFAIMKHSVTAFCDQNSDKQLILNWAGTATGLTHVNKNIDGSEIESGMPVVGFWEPGYRCNGGTFFTNLIMATWSGSKIGRCPIENILRSSSAMEFVDKLTVPSVSYAKTISRVHGWLPDGNVRAPSVKITGIAHITGGGIEKFKELLPVGIGADLNSMLMPAEVLLQAQELSWDLPNLRLTDRQAYTTLHGGCGMMVICKTEKDAQRLIMEAKIDRITARVIGKTTSSETNDVRVQSQFRERAELVF